MNCANHTNVSAEHYCRTCGKPLCATCTRDVHGVIYCENCLAARLEGVQPPPVPVMPTAPVYGQGPQRGPNPALAGILGAIPFGVGAVYNGQYAKGLAHLIIFTLLVIGAGQGNETISTICGIGIAFFVLYQIVDAVRSAHAIQAGQPAPDPFGLGQAFGAGERLDVSKVPTGAVVLIGIGTLFLLQTIGLFSFNFGRIWPIFLIVLGGWLFVKNSGLAGSSLGQPRTIRGRPVVTGPAILVTVGVLSLLENTTRFGWDRTWPVLLLVIGIMLLVRNTGFRGGQGGPGAPTAPGTGATPSSSSNAENETPQSPADEVKNV